MGRALATVVCAAAAALLAGCMEHARSVRSLKDHVPRPEHSVIDRMKVEAPKPVINIVDRAKAEQAARCGQRHIEHGNGTLKETKEQKLLADSICVELHRYDHVQDVRAVRD